MNKIQKCELEILKAISKFCEKNNIKYSLIGGTMIGAVRHQGFIPWDDDIDLAMIRQEYEKFIICVKKQNYFIDEYRVMLPECNDYFYPFIKVINTQTLVCEERINEMFPLGVWVDIFPLDYCDTKEERSKEETKKRVHAVKELLRFVAKDSSRLKAFGRNIYLSIRKNVNKKDWKVLKHFLSTKPSEGDKKCIGSFVWPLSDKYIYPAQVADGYTYVLFEGEKYMMFGSYDLILRLSYGNYMQLPPEAERVNHGLTMKYIK
ncbi:MAG: LicD family protein [Dorea sp.]|jgi:lipopolysaccharide cholinephosphotransferase|nr:LicD family protein [Dorea sp.]GFI43960.1 hypothetical protein IMSAGC018_01639 [Lachnospiraceae bacterium]